VESLGPASYTGTDMAEGPGVDVVCDAADLPRQKKLAAPDVVISTEMLEHAEDWQAALAGMLKVLAPGGLLVLTTRSEGFPYHGYPGDHWRFSTAAMGGNMAAAGMDVTDLRDDTGPGSPGVFVSARKPAGWAQPRGMRKTWATAGGVTAMTP
jgi:SAM-dependent methyltransferase